MTPVTLLDASAIIVFLQGEPGAAVVRQALQTGRCVVGAANLAEVIAKSIDRGIAPERIKAILAELSFTEIDVKAEDGAQAGWMRSQTRPFGLSLGDRLCLATAQRLKAKVLTADRPWLNVAKQMGLDIQCIRPDAH